MLDQPINKKYVLCLTEALLVYVIVLIYCSVSFTEQKSQIQISIENLKLKKLFKTYRDSNFYFLDLLQKSTWVEFVVMNGSDQIEAQGKPCSEITIPLAQDKKHFQYKNICSITICFRAKARLVGFFRFVSA